jgi:hypothetical protein
MTLVTVEPVGSSLAKYSLMRRVLPEPLAYSVTDAARVAGLGRSTV